MAFFYVLHSSNPGGGGNQGGGDTGGGIASRLTISDWATDSSYLKGELTVYMGKLYRIKNSITKSTLSPDIDPANYEQFIGSGSSGSSGSIKFTDFTAEHDYSYSECIVHDLVLLTAKSSFKSGTDFNPSDWNVIADMKKSIYDKNNNGIVEDSEHAKIADISIETTLVQSWKPFTEFKAGQNLVHNYETYTVTTNFISGNTFDKTNLKLSGTGNHNGMDNLQGGDSINTEYYHIIKKQYDLIQKMSEITGKFSFDGTIMGDMQKSIYDKNNDGIVDVSTTLDGLITTITELNLLHGITGNVQSQINALSSIGNFTGTSPTYADLATVFTSPKPKDMCIVIADENKGGTSSIYLYSTTWTYAGSFTATIRDFSVDPINVGSESVGLYLEDRIDPLIARKSDVPNFPNLALLLTYDQTNSDLTDAINKMHAHSNKSLLDTYTQTNIDIANAINKMHTHSNSTVLSNFSEDANGNPLYKGNTIVGTGSGGGGITDLSVFNTGDLSDSVNRRYVTDAEKANIQSLSTIVSTQNTMNGTLTNLVGTIPSDASATNKLVSTSTMNSKFSALKINDLANVANPLVPNSFLMTNNAGDRVIYLNSISSMIKIQKITDIDGIEFNNVPFLKFKNLAGVQAADGTLELSIKNMFTTNLLDMPSVYEDYKVLVSNKNLQKYELKGIGELTNSKENFAKTIQQVDWQFDTTLQKYTVFVDHRKESVNLIVGFLDSENNHIDNIGWKIYDINQIILIAPTNNSIRVVVNCSQGAVGSGTGTGGSATVTVSDFLDDTRVRTDKAYSSSKTMSVLGNYALKSTVYTQSQSNSLYASKTNEHIHNNIDCLNGLSKDVDDNLFFNGKKVLLDTIQPFTYQNHWADKTFASDTLLIDVNTIFNTNLYSAILQTEFTIRNNIATVDEATDAKGENQLHVLVMDNSLAVLDVLIPPGSTQKYILGISPNIQIMVSGQFSANYYLTAY